MKNAFCYIILSILLLACSKDKDIVPENSNSTYYSTLYPAVNTKFSGSINLDKLANYEAQPLPSYIFDEINSSNPITNKGATLGRVLFYDKELSIDKSISCGSCHHQSLAFGDDKIQSDGVNGGLTIRHSMRLVNLRFSTESKFFWDERADNIEEHTTMPIKDHREMGFSGENGNPDFNDLLIRLQAIEYYKELFYFVYGEELITEERIQLALSQFVRSIQSYDSKFDVGRAWATNHNDPFHNYTAEENLGKQLFLKPPQLGGAGCHACHAAPDFDINPSSRNNGIIATIGSNDLDLNNTRAPSLRDVVKANGSANGPMMHDGSKATLAEVIDHYDRIVLDSANTNLDNRLRGTGSPGMGGQGQDLQLTQAEKDALVAFIATLGGRSIYNDPKWSDPF